MSSRHVAIAATIAVLSIVVLVFVWPHSSQRASLPDAETSVVETNAPIALPPPSPVVTNSLPPTDRKAVSHVHRAPRPSASTTTSRGPMVDLRE